MSDMRSPLSKSRANGCFSMTRSILVCRGIRGYRAHNTVGGGVYTTKESGRSVDDCGDPSAASGLRIDHEPAAHSRKAVGHIGQPHADRGRIEPSPGIADRQGDRLVVGVGSDSDGGARPAVLGRVLQRFSSNTALPQSRWDSGPGCPGPGAPGLPRARQVSAGPRSGRR